LGGTLEEAEPPRGGRVRAALVQPACPAVRAANSGDLALNRFECGGPRVFARVRFERGRVSVERVARSARGRIWSARATNAPCVSPSFTPLKSVRRSSCNGRGFAAKRVYVEFARGLRAPRANSDWTIEGGEREMKAWLRMFDGYKAFPTLLVGAQNDAMAFGAYRAFSNSGRQTQPGAVRFTGVDGSPGHGLRWTSEGQLTATPRPPAELLLRPSSFPELHVLEKIGLEGRTSGVHRRDSKNIRVDAASSRARIATRRK